MSTKCVSSTMVWRISDYFNILLIHKCVKTYISNHADLFNTIQIHSVIKGWVIGMVGAKGITGSAQSA